MKTFGLIVRNGTRRIFDPNVRELLENQTTLVQIICERNEWPTAFMIDG